MSTISSENQLFPCFLVIDPPAAGAWNMAVDEYHLEMAVSQATPVFRLYQWAPGTLSLGYFQDYQDRLTHKASLEAPLVRRPSGGGGILHDRELTYSVAVPASHVWAKKRIDFYEIIHQSLIQVLREFGITAFLYRDYAKSFVGKQMCHELREKKDLPFLCFQRRTGGDIVLGETKIVGSAQYRRGHGFIQHGSILLEWSPLAPELPGIAEITKKNITADEFSEKWLPILGKTLSLDLQLWKRSENDLLAIEKIAQKKFLTDSWNKKVR